MSYNFAIPISYINVPSGNVSFTSIDKLYVNIILYSKIYNTKELLENMFDLNSTSNILHSHSGIDRVFINISEFNSCYIALRPEMILSVDHIIHGIVRSVYNVLNNKLSTANFNSEVVFMISGSKSVTKSIKHMCIDRFDCNDTPILIVGISKDPQFDNYLDFVVGDKDDLSNLPNYSNKELIIKEFNISNEELTLPGGLSQCIMCRIGTKCIC